MKDEKLILCKECRHCYEPDHYAGTGLCRKMAGPFQNQNVIGLNTPACDLFERKKDETTLCPVHDKASVDSSRS